MARAQGNPGAAIDAAVSYLDIYCNDVEGWEELAELYLQSCMYKLVRAPRNCLCCRHVALPRVDHQAPVLAGLSRCIGKQLLQVGCFHCT